MPVTSGYGVQYWDQWVKYFLTRDPSYNSLDTTLAGLANGFRESVTSRPSRIATTSTFVLSRAPVDD
jgi:hypothetical protein